MAELKNTKQRGAIMQVLKSLAEPASAEEVFAELKDSCPTLALSTVYRNLERFAAAGLVKKDSFNDGIIRYSLVNEHHGHYLICTECDCKIKIDDCPLSGMEQELAENTGFEIDGHNLTIYGKCPKCKNNRSTK